MSDINQKYTVNASPEKLYEALTQKKHLAAWWVSDCLVDAYEGGYAKFSFAQMCTEKTMRVERLIPGRLVEWTVVDASSNGERNEWVGTRIRFQITPGRNGASELAFFHGAFPGETEMYRRVTQGWGHFLGTSLKSYVEEGKGGALSLSKGSDHGSIHVDASKRPKRG
jgi:uncharacterized protein YndB with AHSA1/START domain